MPQSLTQDQLDLLEMHVEAGDRIVHYSQLVEFGFEYGRLALGVVTNNFLHALLQNEG